MIRRIAILGTGDGATGTQQVPAAIQAATGNDCKPELVDVPGAVFPATPADRDRAAQAYVTAGTAAAAAGYQALYINTFGDYGLRALRKQVGIPVMGSGEAAIRLARATGREFSIVTIWPPALRFIYQQVLEDSGAAGECRSIRFLSADTDLAALDQADNFVTDMQACGLTSMTKIRQACATALNEDGAAVILLGCTCMQPVAALLQKDGFPVIEPMVAGYQVTESLLAGA